MSAEEVRKGNTKAALKLLEYESEFEETLIAAVEVGCVRVIRVVLALDPYASCSYELLEAVIGQTDELARDLVLSAPRRPGSWPITVRMDDVMSHIDVISLMRCYSPCGWYRIGFTVPGLVDYALDLDKGDFMHLAQPEERPQLLEQARETGAIECVEVLVGLL